MFPITSNEVSNQTCYDQFLLRKDGCFGEIRTYFILLWSLEYLLTTQFTLFDL